MGNSQTKEVRGSVLHDTAAGPSLRRDQENASQRPHRASNPRRGSRPDISAILGLSSSNEPDVSSLEARRENKAEREARKQEKEKQARLKERQRSMEEEHVDGGYLVTQGVYIGVEDFNKQLVRQLMIERRLAPFYRGLNDFSESWAEHQIVAVARGMPLPPADQVPPELELQLSKRPTIDATQTLGIPITSRSESFQSDSGRVSPAYPSSFRATSTPHTASSSIPFRSRAKTLASLGSASRNNSEKDLSPREFKLPHDSFVNGQPIEVTLYKDATECPICFLYYPPFLNTTRCCEQAICSECFVQIKRPEPHVPEHTDPDPNASPVPEEERLAQSEGMLVSEVATCPYCKQPEFGITYTPPPFRRGLTYGIGNNSYGIISARSSQTSVASSTLSPATGRRRGTSLSANAPEVITTDKIRPDWASKLATARAHSARRSAAASALHAAAYLMNDQQAMRPMAGPFGRRSVLRRSTLESNGQRSEAELNALAFLAERHAALQDRAQQAQNGHGVLAPPRGSSSRRSRVDELEDMMMMEAIRLSLAAEEDRRRREEKDAKKKAKRDEKDAKKAEKSARKQGQGSPSSLAGATAVDRTVSNVSLLAGDDIGKGKSAERVDPAMRIQLDGESAEASSRPTSLLTTSQESLTAPMSIPGNSPAEPFRRSHLRQMSNASSASSSFQETSSTPAINEPMFNFRSLAAMIDADEKANGADHVEDVENNSHDSLIMHSNDPEKTRHDSTDGKLKNVSTVDEVLGQPMPIPK